MSRLITASIVGAVDWARRAPEGKWREKGMKDLENQLNRVWVEAKPGEPFEFQRMRGKKFESMLEAHTNTNMSRGSEHFRWFIEQCKGGVFQKTVKRFINIDGYEYCLYGKVDVWFKDVLKDIKTTDRYGGQDKYLGSFQHSLYCFIERIPRFVYLIAEFEEGTNKIIDRYTLDYTVSDWSALREYVIDVVRETVKFIESVGMLRAFANTFSRYNNEKV